MLLQPQKIFYKFERLIQEFFGKLKEKHQSYTDYFSNIENPSNDPNITKNGDPKIDDIKSMMLLLENIRSLFFYEGVNQSNILSQQNSLIIKSKNSNQDSILRDGKECQGCIRRQLYISCLLEKYLNGLQESKSKVEDEKQKIRTELENLQKEIKDEQLNNINMKTINIKIEGILNQQGINELSVLQFSCIAQKEDEESQNSVLQFLDQKIIYNERNQINQSEKCQALCFNKDDKLIATAKHNEIVLWTFQEGKMDKINGNTMRHKGEISCLLFDKDSDILISGGGDFDCQIKIWECTGQMKWKLQKETQKLDGGVKAMLLNKKRDKLFIGTQKGQIAIFEVNFETSTLGQPKIQQINQNSTSIFGLSLNEDEKYLVSCGQDCYLRLFSLDQGLIQLIKKNVHLLV
ncbi:unnamed protein product (macronuclear) [Paramecium tetraurelia]|uniref:Anaphase-promoting complex subunit 4 WD40 domain-containing protein n=1 Tax=Paramecium tetraurelia TaxID=5888 RepID=A0BMQ0_PARTE|nr:uncharacterized protein GSPATT00030453001 [Paramecium tetraurelia]CAK59817.1 unnamed protein product [Paramecium tetraurelia]|eukprot:XP_001427215.1 hypothetical protein (macronuclear) [Paramecium tetraurelia strain d4-2]